MRGPDSEILADIARRAGQAILAVRRQGFAVTTKADDTPLTTADTRSSRCILDGLAAAFPDLPVLCEETRPESAAIRAAWRRCFVVDPLDGTKEFARGRDDFCVCLALVEDGRPVFGVIAAPVADTLYWGGPGLGAWRRRGVQPARPIRAAPPVAAGPLVVLSSVSHPDPRLAGYLDRLGAGCRLENLGSALKFCALAEGRAHLYPRYNATWEWDIAAGHALLLGAGGSLHGPGGAPFPYNKPDLRNGPFLARAWSGQPAHLQLPDFP